MDLIDKLHQAIANNDWSSLNNEELDVITRGPASAQTDIKAYPGKKMSYNPAEMIRQGTNEALDLRDKGISRIGADVAMVAPEADADKASFREAINLLRNETPRFSPSRDYNSEIENLIDGASQTVPKRDPLSEAIVSLGPALLGSLTGEAGALVAPVSGKQSRDIYEAQKKQDVDSIIKKKSDVAKRAASLLSLKKEERSEFDKATDRDITKASKIVEAQKALAGMTEKELAEYKKMQNSSEIKLAESKQKGVKDVAGMQNKSDQMESAEKRASIMAGLNRDKMNIPTDAERRAASAYSTLQRATGVLNEIGGEDGSGFPSLKDPIFSAKASLLGGRMKMGEFIDSVVKDEKVRRQLAAEADWLAVKLRRDSGAAINVGEYIAESSRYFPRQGDSPQIVAEKAAARAQAEAGMLQEAGRATPPAIVKTAPVKSESAKQDKDVSDYAKKYNLSYEKALSIINKRRGK